MGHRQDYVTGCSIVAEEHSTGLSEKMLNEAIEKDAAEFIYVPEAASIESRGRGRRPIALPSYGALAERGNCVVPPTSTLALAEPQNAWVTSYPFQCAEKQQVLSTWLVLLGPHTLAVLQAHGLHVPGEALKHRDYVRQRMRSIASTRVSAKRKRKQSDEGTAGRAPGVFDGAVPVCLSVQDDAWIKKIAEDLKNGVAGEGLMSSFATDDMFSLPMVEVSLNSEAGLGKMQPASEVYESPRRRRPSSSCLRVIVPSNFAAPIAVLGKRSLFVPAREALEKNE